jgi:hypothetical protein
MPTVVVEPLVYFTFLFLREQLLLPRNENHLGIVISNYTPLISLWHLGLAKIISGVMHQLWGLDLASLWRHLKTHEPRRSH